MKNYFFSAISEASEKIVDVRIPLQFLVKDRSLQIASDQTKVRRFNYL
jgi:hypothetical protein